MSEIRQSIQVYRFSWFGLVESGPSVCHHPPRNSNIYVHLTNNSTAGQQHHTARRYTQQWNSHGSSSSTRWAQGLGSSASNPRKGRRVGTFISKQTGGKYSATEALQWKSPASVPFPSTRSTVDGLLSASLLPQTVLVSNAANMVVLPASSSSSAPTHHFASSHHKHQL